MKIITILVIAAISLAAADAAAQDRKQKTTISAQEATPAMNVRPLKDMVRDVDADNVGVCLRGEKAKLIDSRSDAKNCDSVLWIAARNWAAVQHELNTGASGRLSAGNGGTKGKCSSCSGVCQIVSWISGGSKYEGVDVGGGQSASECIDAVKKACESGAARFMTSAHCGS
jgi:hypothetical protein